MRLICPNCGAQYEVDSTVIPDAGRDVQCSNCGHTWFQRNARQVAEEPETQAESPQTIDQQQAEPTQEPADQSQESETEETSVNDPETEPDAPKRQPLDDNVANILRQEAEQEAAKRAPSAGGLEIQPDLGLNQNAAGAAQNPMERSADLNSSTEHDGRRKDLLPDIEEINSTLAASTTAAAAAAVEEPVQIQRRSGFRRGFLLAIAIFAILALIYVFAARISGAMPFTSSALASYVDWVDALRSALDNLMLGAVDKLTGLLAQLSGEQSS